MDISYLQGVVLTLGGLCQLYSNKSSVIKNVMCYSYTCGLASIVTLCTMLWFPYPIIIYPTLMMVNQSFILSRKACESEQAPSKNFLLVWGTMVVLTSLLFLRYSSSPSSAVVARAGEDGEVMEHQHMEHQQHDNTETSS